ncbi:hypothetical protein [Pelagerythrobacter aerophilus]|uniref:hypothetical protein n=1 Tax=Pelagerythrobacter aerophilus TaxID=2306995 RepID=UPI0011C36DAF|nr:hypothetical protein [Pelagerythrobacter aerophilus]
MRDAFWAIVALSLASQTAPTAVLAQSMPDGSQPAACVGLNRDNPVPLDSRIGRPDPAIIEIFSGAGASAISAHELTPQELTIVKRALARLPRLHRDVLQHHLRRLSFLDLQPGSGSALTSRAGLDETRSQFDITLRASLLDESLTAFLNTKEARLFEDDGSGFSVEFDAGQSDALAYILLHEATHIVDQVLGLSEKATGSFRADIWKDLRTLSEPHASSLAARTPFRRAPAIPRRYSPAFYESLRKSPFVSFYASAAAPEDLAELFAWQQLASRFNQSLTLTVRDREGFALYRYEPLKAPEVSLRFSEVQALLDRYEQHCGSVTKP